MHQLPVFTHLPKRTILSEHRKLFAFVVQLLSMQYCHTDEWEPWILTVSDTQIVFFRQFRHRSDVSNGAQHGGDGDDDEEGGDESQGQGGARAQWPLSDGQASGDPAPPWALALLTSLVFIWSSAVNTSPVIRHLMTQYHNTTVFWLRAVNA